jgi:tetratricopeptide (TPR) repeat protein
MALSTRSKQILLVAGAVVLTVSLYLAPQHKSESSNNAEKQSSFSIEEYILQQKKKLGDQSRQAIEKVEEGLKEDTQNLQLLDSLVALWGKERQIPLSAYYAEMKATKQPSEQNWLNAAYRYFDSFKMENDSVLRKAWVDKTISCYQNVLSLNPHNLDAKTDLGLCYAEGTAEPMKGIMMLREVVQADSMHENAQYNLGILSVRSGQYEKAIERFEKVLLINPSRTEMYFIIGRTYMMMGNKESARTYLEEFKSTSKDMALVNETNNILQQLNNN